MRISIEKNAEVTIVALEGDIDAGTSPELKSRLDHLLSGGSRNFVIDMSAVRFIDSSAIATLVHLFKRVRIGDGDVRISGLQPRIQRLFELTRLQRVFDTFEDRESAVASFGDSNA